MEVSEKIRAMMKDFLDGDDDESEEISQTFICCVCRELLYKPLVLGCGHVSCFWCVHYSMNGLHKSSCPVCRNQYYHFPSVCRVLHFLLMKIYPNAYRRRENQILEEEKTKSLFSPQLHLESIEKGDTVAIIEQVEPGIANKFGPFNDVGPSNIRGLKDIVSTSASIVEDSSSDSIHGIGAFDNVSVSDVLCGSCEGVLFRPIVFNCGHAFCTGCTVLDSNEMIKCQICQSSHPGGVPKVCLEFDHFLEEQFPKEYQLRRETLQMEREKLSCEAPNTSKSEAGSKGSEFSVQLGSDPTPWFGGSSTVHTGIVCDSCGMYPIVGDRYKCKDCVEKVGYNLCKDCYANQSELRGRFNQQHKSDHSFELVETNSMSILMEQINNISAISVALREISVNISRLNPTNENADNTAEDAHRPASDTEESEE